MVQTVHGRGSWGSVSGGQVCKGAGLPGHLSQALRLDLCFPKAGKALC